MGIVLGKRRISPKSLPLTRRAKRSRIECAIVVVQEKFRVGLQAGTVGQSHETLIQQYLALPLKDTVKETWRCVNVMRVFRLAQDARTRCISFFPHNGVQMTDKIQQVYVIQGRSERDFSDCQAALAHVPARVTILPFITAEDEVIARTRDAAALVTSSTRVTRKVMSALEGLKVVMRTGVGYDVIDVPAATELGVIAVNIPDIWVREVANHTMALILAWNRKIITLDRNVHAGSWGGGIPGAWTGSLYGQTVGIVGLGNIGSAFARRVAAFETTVIANDPYVGDARFKALGVERVSLETLAARADYVSVHTPLNAETHHLIGEAFFRSMKPTALLVNTSRGPVVDERALAQALTEKRLAAAALDVWEQEPVAADNPLLRMDNVIATPHAAFFSSPAVAQVPRRCGEEVARVLTGQRPLNVVNLEVYAAGAARRAG
ncbi:MAG: C-terminal binding protein [Pseudomonadota bacterium]